MSDSKKKYLEFGTGGLRGIIGPEADEMNVDTVRVVSRAFAEYLIMKNSDLREEDSCPSVVIAYDNRKFSDIFALESAHVFSENNIRVWLFRDLTPTPMLSYAVRKLEATGGVVITASHNPREYNGYKIYDNTGCQCLPDEATKVSELMESIIRSGEGSDSKAVKEDHLIEFVPDDVNSDYYNDVMTMKAFSGNPGDVRVVYTPLNGTGSIPVETVFKRAGIKEFHMVDSQKDPDPEFTTCPKPNPEEDDAMKERIKLCRFLEKKSQQTPDILMATDPDCDRVGLMIKTGEGYTRLDGNQVGILLFDYIIKSLSAKKSLPDRPVFITTIVSTPMAEEIAGRNNIHIDKVLTGFKYIGDLITEYDRKNEGDRFIFGFEESCGYLATTDVRDKDAVSTCLLIADMVAYYKADNITLTERMEQLYQEYGYYLSSQKSVEMSGVDGLERINRLMSELREPQIQSRFSKEVVEFLDYNARSINNLPKENVLEFNFADRSKVIVRPSGTEPKVKIYFTATGDSLADTEKNMTEIQEDFINNLILT